MKLPSIYQWFSFFVCFVFTAAEIVEFNATCWDMQTYSGPRASLSDILKAANAVETRGSCYIRKDSDDYFRRELQGSSGDAFAYLLWTPSDINKGVFEVQYPCATLASRIRKLANACAAILETQYLSIWTVLNACDGDVTNTNRPYLPAVNQSGVAFSISGGSEKMVPDLKGSRAGKPFASIKLLLQEDEAPLPGWGIN